MTTMQENHAMAFNLPTAVVVFVLTGFVSWRFYGRALGNPLPRPWSRSSLLRYSAAVAVLCALTVGDAITHMGDSLPLYRYASLLGYCDKGDDYVPFRCYGGVDEHGIAICSLMVLLVLMGLVVARAASRLVLQPTLEQGRAAAFSWRDSLPAIVSLVLLVPAGVIPKPKLMPDGTGVIAGALVLLWIGSPFWRRVVTSCGSPASSEATDESFSRDRQRILQLLEEGKINGTESAALLSALAEGTRGEQSNEPLAAGRKQMLFGALVVLVGFFLPWFNVDLAAEMNRIMPSSVQLGPQFGGATMSMPQFGGSSGRAISIHAGDIAHGLGWWVLILALVAAGLPFLMPAMPRQTQRAVTFVSLIGMAIIELYLLTGSLGSAVWGIWIALVGTAILWAGTFREFASPRLTPAVLA